MTAATIEEQEQKIFSSGRRAQQAGIALKDCPFAKGSDGARLWKSGWRSVGTETDTGI